MTFTIQVWLLMHGYSSQLQCTTIEEVLFTSLLQVTAYGVCLLLSALIRPLSSQCFAFRGRIRAPLQLRLAVLYRTCQSPTRKVVHSYSWRTTWSTMKRCQTRLRRRMRSLVSCHQKISACLVGRAPAISLPSVAMHTAASVTFDRGTLKRNHYIFDRCSGASSGMSFMPRGCQRFGTYEFS